MTKEELIQAAKPGGQAGAYHLRFINGIKPKGIPEDKLNSAELLKDLYEAFPDKSILDDYKTMNLSELKNILTHIWLELDDIEVEIAKKYNVEAALVSRLATSIYGIYVFISTFTESKS